MNWKIGFLISFSHIILANAFFLLAPPKLSNIIIAPMCDGRKVKKITSKTIISLYILPGKNLNSKLWSEKQRGGRRSKDGAWPPRPARQFLALTSLSQGGEGLFAEAGAGEPDWGSAEPRHNIREWQGNTKSTQTNTAELLFYPFLLSFV